MATMIGALGHEARLAIVRRLLKAHPEGLVAGELQEALGIPASTLSHHLDTLHRHGMVQQTREGKFLRYRASADGLTKVLGFLVDECCSKNEVVSAGTLLKKRPA